MASRSRLSSTSRMSSMAPSASRMRSVISNMNSSALSGFSSALSTFSTLRRDKKLIRKVVPFDLRLMQKMLTWFNFISLLATIALLAASITGALVAIHETCLIQPYNPNIKPTRVEPNFQEGYTCTGNMLYGKNDSTSKFNLLLGVSGIFFLTQAKLVGYMGSAYMVIRHLFICVLFFVFAYILLGSFAMLEFGSSYRKQLFAYLGLPAWLPMILIPYILVEVCMIIITLRLIMRWNQFLRGKG